MGGRLAVVGTHRVAGLGLEHQAQGVGGQGHHHLFGVAVVGHHDHGQLLVRQHRQLRREIISATAVLEGANAGAHRLIAARGEKPSQAHLAVEVQGVAGVLLAEHLVNRLAAQYLSVFIEAPGEEHAHVVAEVLGAAPQATGRKVAHLGVGADGAFCITPGAKARLRAGADEARLVHLQGLEQAALQSGFEILPTAAFDGGADQGVAEVGIGHLGPRWRAQPNP